MLLAATILGGGSIPAADALANTMAAGDFSDVGRFALAGYGDTDLSLIQAEGKRIEGDVMPTKNVHALSPPTLDVAGIADEALGAARDPTVPNVAAMLSGPENLRTPLSGMPDDLIDISVSVDGTVASVVAPTDTNNPDPPPATNDGVPMAVAALAAVGLGTTFLLLALVNRGLRQALVRRVKRNFGRRRPSLTRRLTRRRHL